MSYFLRNQAAFSLNTTVIDELNTTLPYVLTNFQDKNWWVPIGDDFSDALTFSGSGGVLCRTSAARNNNMMVMSGVHPRFTLFPDNDGDLNFEFRIEDYVHAGDYAAGDLSGVGILIQSGYQDHMAILAGGINVAANPLIIRATTNAPSSNALNGTDSFALGAAIVSLIIRFNVAGNTGANPARYEVEDETNCCSYNLNAAGFLNFAVGGGRLWAQGLYINFTGIRFALGLFGKTRNLNEAGRFVSFTLNSGKIAFGC